MCALRLFKTISVLFLALKVRLMFVSSFGATLSKMLLKEKLYFKLARNFLYLIVFENFQRFIKHAKAKQQT